MADSYHRCTHCRGFYEAERPHCKWCNYDTVFTDANGKPVVYPDRETCRAIQIAEYEQLPEEAHADPMRPPPDALELRCACLHCGPGGHVFEAVEMRWHPVEKMWACPCTTCGGRGFHFDIHPVDPVWQCAECGHIYTPEQFTEEHADCPKCGSKYANGWFDDAEMTDEEYEAYYNELLADDILTNAPPPPDGASPPEAFEDEIPWDDDSDLDIQPFDPDDPSLQPWYPGKDEDDERAELPGEPPIPDDIDHPRRFPDDDHSSRRDDGGEDDIPF